MGEIVAEIRFEDEVIRIQEDIETLDVAYDIQDNNLIAVKTLKQTLSSKIYNYDDGISVYLKFEDSGNFINVMFAIYQAGGEKQILSVPRHADLYLRRLDKFHFHIIAKDEINYESNLVAITIKDETEVATVQFNFTNILEYKIIDDKYVLINGYEDLNDGNYLYTMGVYNLAGKALKVMLDKKITNPNGYEFVIQLLPNGRRRLLAINTANGGTKVIGKVLLPEGYSKEEINMLEANKQMIRDSAQIEMAKKHEETLTEDQENEGVTTSQEDGEENAESEETTYQEGEEAGESGGEEESPGEVQETAEPPPQVDEPPPIATDEGGEISEKERKRLEKEALKKQKEEEKLAKQAEKEREKQAKQALKEQEKQEKLAKKEQERLAKEANNPPADENG